MESNGYWHRLKNPLRVTLGIETLARRREIFLNIFRVPSLLLVEKTDQGKGIFLLNLGEERKDKNTLTLAPPYKPQ